MSPRFVVKTVKNVQWAITAHLEKGFMIVSSGKTDAHLVHPKTDREVLLQLKPEPVKS